MGWLWTSRTEHAYVSSFPTAHRPGLLRACARSLCAIACADSTTTTASMMKTDDGRRKRRGSCLSISATVQTASYRVQMRENARKQIWLSQADEYTNKLPTTRPSPPSRPTTTRAGCMGKDARVLISTFSSPFSSADHGWGVWYALIPKI